MESGAKAGVPFGVAEAEDVTALRSRRSDPERLKWSEVSEENVGGIQKMSERTNSIFSVLEEKKIKNVAKNVCSPILARYMSICFKIIKNLSKQLTLP